MCGRFTLHHNTSQIALRFEVQERLADIAERYHIAPTQPIAAVTVNSPRTLQMMRWGLIPSWAKDPAIGNKMINARAETLPEKPSYRTALRRRRCLIPSDGFYEWQLEGKGKQPMYIHRKDGELFAFAGLWDEWHSPEGETVRSCTIITTTPNDLMAPIHNRMPAILRPDEEAEWLDMSVTEVEAILSLLRPYPAEELEAYPVSRLVNTPMNDEAECIQPELKTR